ncbi:unnamed protein product [Calypogeia fissa]
MGIQETVEVPEKVCDVPQQQTGKLAVETQAVPFVGDVASPEEEKGVRELLRNYDGTRVPEYYIKPENMRKDSTPVNVDPEAAKNTLPVIDLSAPHEELVKAIGKACQWGFFQIINHGTDPTLLKKIAAETEEFFSLPLEEKIRCTTPQKVSGPIHFGGGSSGDWRDVLKINCAPPSAVAMDCWPESPVGFRETLLQYVTEQDRLMVRLLAVISESLGLEPDHIAKECTDARALLALNHYPPSPEPSLTMGIREHSDPSTITILLQDQVAGLQLFKEGKWFEVQPVENAFVINAGDHLQIVSNGRYPSCLHRVVNNKFQSRTSIALFYSPALTAKIKPAPELVDEEHPPQYVEFTYGEFLKNFYNNGGPNKKVVLQHYQAGQSKA